MIRLPFYLKTKKPPAKSLRGVRNGLDSGFAR